ncbi:glycosyltransferase family 2 protein [Candidatus Woesearchaeota archaeon]|nr:glycosyltransferase family 2 protein [Candidatus Woesearchaeota archaeon]
MYKKLKVAVITGGYNEEGKISRMLSRIPEYVDEIVFTDDASKDKTADEARSFQKHMNLKVLTNKENRGAGSVLRKGFNYILDRSIYDVIVIVSGDNQDNPDEMNLLLDKIAKGYDFVQGSRNLPQPANGKKVKMPLFRRISTALYTSFSSAILRTKITDSSNGFRAIRTSALKKINYNQDWLNRYELEPYLLIEALKNGCKYTEVPVSKTYDHEAGYSKMRPFIDWYRMLKPFLMEVVRKK